MVARGALGGMSRLSVDMGLAGAPAAHRVVAKLSR